jgi:hypothetical protein
MKKADQTGGGVSWRQGGDGTGESVEPGNVADDEGDTGLL